MLKLAGDCPIAHRLQTGDVHIAFIMYMATTVYCLAIKPDTSQRC